ncbi:MAG: DUF2007 domain-containing protein [Bacteroides sp.]|nr:DUF2007 domain-containing protein [Bacteroidales bacterium]MBD5316364.1 DUF2007 domain-containing protein [Bacteroides sp.]MBD5377684.1 DUF2007 domain-containing protein [Bacteroides sp.]
MDSIVTLATFLTPQEAYIVAGMLHENGIQATVINENNLYVPIVGQGCRVEVFEKDFDKAMELLKLHDDE